MQTFNPGVIKWMVVDNGRHHVKLQSNQHMACPDSYPVTQHEPRIAEVLTPWIGDEQTGFRQQLEIDHAPFVIEDSAGQSNLIPDPNIGMSRIETGAGNMAEIAADSTFHVLWSDSE